MNIGRLGREEMVEEEDRRGGRGRIGEGKEEYSIR
jgi:hypothetical protein